jgi:hypothetical protein
LVIDHALWHFDGPTQSPITNQQRINNQRSTIINDSLPLASFEFLESAGPILAEQPRQRAIGKQPPPGLTRHAVVGFVRRVGDPLDG